MCFCGFMAGSSDIPVIITVLIRYDNETTPLLSLLSIFRIILLKMKWLLIQSITATLCKGGDRLVN